MLLQEDALKFRDFAPVVLPANWSRIAPPAQLVAVCGAQNCAAYMSALGTKAILSLDDYEQDGKWLHLSVSRLGRLPTWNELKGAKELFLGDRLAIQLLPPKSHWISISECLHLFHRLDADTVPPGIWGAAS